MAQRSDHAGIAQLGQRRCVQVAVLNGSQVRILLPALAHTVCAMLCDVGTGLNGSASGVEWMVTEAGFEPAKP